MLVRWLSCLAVAALILTTAGCGQSDLDRVTVRGEVRYHGELLTGGVIVFVSHAERSTNNEMAVGTIRPDGSFQVKVEGPGGVMPGWYRVSISSAYSPGRRFGPQLPDKYRDPLTSGIEREVKGGTENVLGFNLP